MSIAALWLGVSIFIAWTIEAMSGFGSIVIALALGALLLPIPELLPVLVPLNVAMTSVLVWRLRAQVDRALLGRRILPLMAAGTLAGVALRDVLGGPWLKAGFALLVLWFAGRELWRQWRGTPPPTHAAPVTGVLMGSAGITHGLFASGGPLLVYALAGQGLDKTRFRATLLAVWLLLNSGLALVFLWQGRLLPALPQVALYLPLIVVGAWLGNRLHHGLDEARFRLAVYGLLLVTGLALLAAQLPLLRV